MDRRQRKTKKAIFDAFTELLSKKSYDRISVSEIIEKADVSRSAFYAHFETKDFLLKALYEELFEHIIDTANGEHNNNSHYECSVEEDASVFLHLFCHLKQNDGNIIELLSSENNDIFLRYLKNNLKKLIETQFDCRRISDELHLPADFITNHISSSFVETASWWIHSGMKETPEQISDYFLSTVTGFTGRSGI